MLTHFQQLRGITLGTNFIDMYGIRLSQETMEFAAIVVSPW